MNNTTKAIAAAILAVGFASTHAFAAEPPAAPAEKKHHKAEPKKKPVPAATAAELEELKRDMETQINSLKQQLSDRDSQLKQAQDAAAAAQASASRAEAAASSQQQAVTENAAAVSTLQGTVTDLKTNQVNLVTTIQDSQATIKKAIESPEALHYKGITLSPAGSFIAAETVWRQGAEGSGINTAFTAIPLPFSDNAQVSEFYGTGRQSRIALKAIGKLDNVDLTAYYEADWLGTGITSNSNQSNSYVMRQRQLWADAKFAKGLDVSGGQGWSLATETTQGLTRGTEILPATIDPQYTAGFVWTRQYSFRLSDEFFGKKLFIGASAENAETLNPAGSGLPVNELIGSAGTGGGLYNATANYSWNVAPDMIAKIAVEPGWGHWEVFGISRFFRDRVYPNEVCTTSPTTGTTTCTGSAGAYNDIVPSGGIGGSFRGALLNKKVSLGLKGLYGKGIGRYGSSTIADITLKPDGQISPLKAFSALGTIEVTPVPRLMVYFNYGGDYVYRDYVGKEGYGSPLTSMSGCHTEVVPGNGSAGAYGGGGTGFNPSTPASCGNQNKDVQEFTTGFWYDFYRGPKGRLREGIQYARFERDLWSGVGGANNPGGASSGVDNMFWTSFRYYLP